MARNDIHASDTRIALRDRLRLLLRFGNLAADAAQDAGATTHVRAWALGRRFTALLLIAILALTAAFVAWNVWERDGIDVTSAESATAPGEGGLDVGAAGLQVDDDEPFEVVRHVTHEYSGLEYDVTETFELVRDGGALGGTVVVSGPSVVTALDGAGQAVRSKFRPTTLWRCLVEWCNSRVTPCS